MEGKGKRDGEGKNMNLIAKSAYANHGRPKHSKEDVPKLKRLCFVFDN